VVSNDQDWEVVVGPGYSNIFHPTNMSSPAWYCHTKQDKFSSTLKIAVHSQPLAWGLDEELAVCLSKLERSTSLGSFSSLVSSGEREVLNTKRD